MPTATQRILGNDRFDLGGGLLAEQPVGDRLLVLANIDVTSVHAPLALKTLDLAPVMVTGTLSFEYFLTHRASARLQWTAATNPYPKFHPDMSTLNGVPMGIGVGWAYRLFGRTKLQVHAAENIYSPWPDFAWGFSLKTDV